MGTLHKDLRVLPQQPHRLFSLFPIQGSLPAWGSWWSHSITESPCPIPQDLLPYIIADMAVGHHLLIILRRPRYPVLNLHAPILVIKIQDALLYIRYEGDPSFILGDQSVFLLQDSHGVTVEVLPVSLPVLPVPI